MGLSVHRNLLHSITVLGIGWENQLPVNWPPPPEQQIFKTFFLKCFIVPSVKFRSPYMGKALEPQEQRYPFLSVCAVFVCPNNAMAASN